MFWLFATVGVLDFDSIIEFSNNRCRCDSKVVIVPDIVRSSVVVILFRVRQICSTDISTVMLTTELIFDTN